jgi:hypothetical protein
MMAESRAAAGGEEHNTSPSGTKYISLPCEVCDAEGRVEPQDLIKVADGPVVVARLGGLCERAISVDDTVGKRGRRGAEGEGGRERQRGKEKEKERATVGMCTCAPAVSFLLLLLLLLLLVLMVPWFSWGKRERRVVVHDSLDFAQHPSARAGARAEGDAP